MHNTDRTTTFQGPARAGQPLLRLLSTAICGGLLVALGLLGASLFGNSGFVSTGLPSIVPKADFLGGFTAQQFWGAALMAFCLPLGLIPTLLVSAEIFHLLHHLPFCRSLIHLGCCAAFCAVGFSAVSQWHAKGLAECLLVGCIFEYDPSFLQKESTMPNGFYPTLGVVGGVTAFSLAVVHVLLAVMSVVVGKEVEVEEGGGLEAPLMEGREVGFGGNGSGFGFGLGMERRWKRWRLVVCLLVAVGVLPALFMGATTLLPSTWLQFTKERVSMYGSLDVATESIDCHLAASTSSAPPLVPFQRVICPEVPKAFLRTKSISLKADHPRVFAKVYPDALLFYIFIYCVLLLGLLNALTPSALPLKRLDFCNGSISLGELLVLILLCFFLAVYTVHWYHDHNWHAYWPQTLPWVRPPSTAEKTARTAGQVANFLCGLLVLPVTRNSAWQHLFGISWTYALNYHKALGSAFLFVVALHMVAWWVVYHEQGVFPHDVLAINMFFPLNFHAKPGQCAELSCLDPEYQQPAADNWTIPLMNLFMLFVGFPVFAFFTHESVRRKNFELFYYSHHIFLVLWFAMLWHANSSWFFTSYGIFLWVVDRVLRLMNTSRLVEIRQVETFKRAKFTRLTLCLSQADVFAGQYVFINVPQLSSWQWHPFSVSGFSTATTKLYIQICVKQSGDFTEGLNAAAAQFGTRLSVRMEGPYGLPLDFCGAENVVVVAGGIGCTPFLPLLTSIHSQAQVPRITLIWVAREHALFEAFAEELRPTGSLICRLFLSAKTGLLEEDKAEHLFDYRTNYTDADYQYSSLPFRTQLCVGCRPAVLYEVEMAIQEAVSDPGNTLILASGPRPLLDECSNVGTKLGIRCRREDFEL